MENFLSQATNVFIIGIPILLAITLHEAAHGFVALRCGDYTALRQGRVTLNPFKHIDLIGTIILPAISFYVGGLLFGYAKPVPVNFRELRNPRRDMALVAIAGPATNVFLAFASALLVKAMYMLSVPAGFLTDITMSSLIFSIHMNALLAIINMLPILPLDGGRVLNSLLPPSWARVFSQTEKYGMFILLGLMIVLMYFPVQVNGRQVSAFSVYFRPIVEGFSGFIGGLAGL